MRKMAALRINYMIKKRLSFEKLYLSYVFRPCSDYEVAYKFLDSNWRNWFDIIQDRKQQTKNELFIIFSTL